LYNLTNNPAMMQTLFIQCTMIFTWAWKGTSWEHNSRDAFICVINNNVLSIWSMSLIFSYNPWNYGRSICYLKSWQNFLIILFRIHAVIMKWRVLNAMITAFIIGRTGARLLCSMLNKDFISTCKWYVWRKALKVKH
jgi:hypothetical protein